MVRETVLDVGGGGGGAVGDARAAGDLARAMMGEDDLQQSVFRGEVWISGPSFWITCYFPTQMDATRDRDFNRTGGQKGSGNRD